MATGPYDLGPFQTLSAINFAQGELDLFALNRVDPGRASRYDTATESWLILSTTGSPPQAGAFAWYPGSDKIYASINASAVMWELPLDTLQWSLKQTLFGSGQAFLASDVIGNTAFVGLFNAGSPNDVYGWNVDTGSVGFIKSPILPGTNQVNFFNRLSSCWDASRNKLLYLNRDVSTSVKSIFGITTGGAESTILTLPSTHWRGGFGARLSGIDVATDGTIWFASNTTTSLELLLCSYDGSTFTEHVGLNPTGGINLEGIGVVPELDNLVLIANNLSVLAWSWDGSTLGNLGNLGGGRSTFLTNSVLG